MIITIKKLYGYTEKKLQEIASMEVSVQGWVKSNRITKTLGFLTVNDGSSLKVLQVIYKNEDEELFKKFSLITTGSAVVISGFITLTPKAPQPFELNAKTLSFVSYADQSYPIQKKAHSLEFLREQAHLRARTATFFAIFKIRSAISFAIHQFFQEQDFLYLHSPIITGNDAEGAGESFTVTTISNDNYEKDFFVKKASLTVSGQLSGESFAQAFKKIYTFGPTFRAENSNTPRHAAEFWMIEPEIAFGTIETIIDLSRNLVIFVANYVIKHCFEELSLLHNKKQETEPKTDLLTRVNQLIKPENYHIVTYTKVIELLLQAQKKGKKFVYSDIKWGIDLQSEHERFLCEEIYNSPVFVINYPQQIKAFYMKVNPETVNTNKITVAAMDLLVPGVGELIGGSVREDNYEQLINNKTAFNIKNNDLEWYFNLRKFGFSGTAGFGMGLERLIIFITGVNNIRDVIPFPRTPKNLLF